MNKLVKFIKDNLLLVLLIILMAIYYGYQMFTNGPWYDELYTYYYFISRGPVYAAIHWPVPNNHIGYSVLSAILDLFGNNTIGLRGVSYLAALCNIVLLYKLTLRFFDRFWAIVAPMLYISFYLVNNLAIQGRGYTLATTCMLYACLKVEKICLGQGSLKDYLGYALSMTLGLYILPSSCYWVVTICLVGGAYTLFSKDYKTMRRLIYYALAAAFLTFLLYAIVWLAIGANLLSKDASGAYYGIYQVKIIMSHPLKAMSTGISYMLDTPYIQSMDRATVIKDLPYYLKDLFDLYIADCGSLIILVLALALVGGIARACANRPGQADKPAQKTEFFKGLYISFFVLMLPVVLIGQSVEPYKRVFSFYGVIVSLCLVAFFQSLEKSLKREKAMRIYEGVLKVLMSMGMLALLFSDSYRGELADRENDIKEIIDQVGFENMESIFYSDDYQKYVFKFYYDGEPEEAAVAEAEYILLDKEYINSDFETPQWPLLYGSEDMKQYSEGYEIVAETENYLALRRDK